MVNGEPVYTKTLICWKLTLAYLTKTLACLNSALLLTLASAGMGFAWLCCWLERFLNGRRATAWLLPLHRAAERSTMPEAEPVAMPISVPDSAHPNLANNAAPTLAKVQPFAMPHRAPRTIDGLLRTRNAASRMEDRASSPMVH